MDDNEKKYIFKKRLGDIENIDFNNKIRNRNNILIWILAFMIFGGFITFLVINRVDLDLSSFDFSDLLAIIVSLYAMNLSIKIYKITQDGSNIFYGEVYTFINNISKTLEGLNESLNSKLAGINEKVDHWNKILGPNNDEETTKLKEEVAKLQEQIKISEEEKSDLLDKLSAQKANKDAREQLETIDKAIIDKKIETSKLMERLKNKLKLTHIHDFYNDLISRLSVTELNAGLSSHDASSAKLLYRSIKNKFSNEEIDALIDSGLIMKNHPIIDQETHEKLVQLYEI